MKQYINILSLFQVKKQRQNDVNDTILMSLLLTVKAFSRSV